MKEKIKKVFITILLLIVILLFFGVLLYDYIPLNQTIPSISEYEPPEEVEKELKEIATEDTSTVVLTYEISESDLGVYEDSNSYDKGKANPFSSYQTNSGVTTNNANSSTGTSTTNASTENSSQASTTTNTNTNTGNTSSGSQSSNTFYEDTTTK